MRVAMAQVLSIFHAHKSFSNQNIFSDLTLCMETGDCVALVGENGAGKSTLIKSILDFISLDQGEITIAGIPSQSNLSRTNIAYLPERFNPPYFLTGNSFFSYMADLWGEQFTATQVHEMLSALCLDQSMLSKSVRNLSKGMCQKLGLAACFVSQKELLILDEPMSGLDPKARVLVKNQISNLRKQNRSVLFSSHLLSDVEQLATRIAILHRARFAYIGTPKECLQKFHATNLEQAYIHCIDSQTQNANPGCSG